MPLTQSLTRTNLGTHTVTIPTTDAYVFVGTLTLPVDPGTVTAGPGGGAGTGTGAAPQLPSQVVVTVNQNGTPVLVTSPGSKGFEVTLNCTAADVITIVTSSSAAIDNQTNAVKWTLSISEGPL